MAQSVVNRNALVIVPTKAYERWASQCPGSDPNLDLSRLPDAGTVYLTPELVAGPENWLARNYTAIFDHELGAWYKDESAWPKDRSFKAFKEFFEIRFCSMVLDMASETLESEEM